MTKKIKFGTGGFRGVISDDFNKETVQYIAQALSNIIIENYQQNRPIIVGYDNRFMSDFAAKWFVEVLNGNDIMKLLNRKPGNYLKEILKDIEEKVVSGKLENDREKLTNYILDYYSSTR